MKLAGRHQTVVMQSLDSCQVVWQLSGSFRVVISSHLAVVNESTGSHQKVARQSFKFLVVVHKLRLQEEVGRKSKKVKVYKVETVNEGG
jgi:hypothetical protein